MVKAFSIPAPSCYDVSSLLLNTFALAAMSVTFSPLPSPVRYVPKPRRSIFDALFYKGEDIEQFRNDALNERDFPTDADEEDEDAAQSQSEPFTTRARQPREKRGSRTKDGARPQRQARGRSEPAGGTTTPNSDRRSPRRAAPVARATGMVFTEAPVLLPIPNLDDGDGDAAGAAAPTTTSPADVVNAAAVTASSGESSPREQNTKMNSFRNLLNALPGTSARKLATERPKMERDSNDPSNQTGSLRKLLNALPGGSRRRLATQQFDRPQMERGSSQNQGGSFRKWIGRNLRPARDITIESPVLLQEKAEDKEEEAKP